MYFKVFIDLEDRLYGETKLQQHIAYCMYKDDYTSKLEKLKYTHDRKKDKDEYKSKIEDYNTKIENFPNDFKIPVEYKPLKKKGQKTSQGSVELYIEPFLYEIGY